MSKNPFLSELARRQDPRVEHVSLCELPPSYKGMAQKREEEANYYILIDPEKLACPFHMMFIFYHELAHIVLGHVDLDRPARSGIVRAAKEMEADIFALHQLGVVDGQGVIPEKHRRCLQCYLEEPKACAKVSRDSEVGNEVGG